VRGTLRHRHNARLSGNGKYHCNHSANQRA
jgi:hypothetical protein